MYFPRLDGIRFVAIMMVIILHFASSIGKHFSTGFYGVNLFFVLSGFLITSILISSKEKSISKAYFTFVIRRALRIFPAYYLTIFILILIGSEFIVNDLSYLLTYTYNYFVNDAESLPAHAHFWSLAVEEQFYIFFPIFVILLRSNIRYLTFFFILIISIAYAQVFFDFLNIKKYDYVGLLTNMGPLALGALGAVVNKESRLIKLIFGNIIIEISAIGFLILVLYTKNFKLMILFSSIINLFLVLKASKFEYNLNFINIFLQNKIVTYVGKVSYGIYLYHGIVGKFVSKYIFQPIWDWIPFKQFPAISFLYDFDWIFRIILITICSTLLASLSFYYFEIYFLRLKDKYFKN
jgi:peptidoglycan/LPS O-acetylase OafA/YrhL